MYTLCPIPAVYLRELHWGIFARYLVRLLGLEAL
jgi:hypothetical protein